VRKLVEALPAKTHPPQETADIDGVVARDGVPARYELLFFGG
jgi:hypothetical protein